MEDASSVHQKDKMAEGNRRGLWLSHASLNGADFAGRGRSFQVVWRTDLKVDLDRTQNCCVEFLALYLRQMIIRIYYSMMLLACAGAAETHSNGL